MPLASMTVTLDYSELRVSSPCVRVVVSLGVLAMSRSLVPASFWLALAERAGAVDSAVRVSDRSFTGWVVEPLTLSPLGGNAEFGQNSTLRRKASS
jgi:hypothetical protein